MKKELEKQETKVIKLTEAEEKSVEEQRELAEKRKEFIIKYEELAKKYGFAVGVDLSSPLNNPSVTVVKLR